MKSRFLTFILILFFSFTFFSNVIAQSCATVYLNDDNLPSLPGALCVDDELALCFDLNVDETTFDASLVEFNYNLLLGGEPSSVELESRYDSGTAIDENASGQICFAAAIPVGPSACEVYELSLEIMSVFYNDPGCENNLIAFDLNLTSPLPIVQTGPDLNGLVPLLGLASLNPISVSVFPNPNWEAVVTQLPSCDGGVGTVTVSASNGQLCEILDYVGTPGMDGCPKVDAVFPELTYTNFTTYTDGDGNEQENPCAISITLPEQIVECSGLTGCTDAMACNYNPDACEDDGSCLSSDCNGDCGGTATAGTTCDDGDAGTENDVYGEDCTCAGTTVSATEGCTDSNACNYNPDATEDNGSCLFNDCTGECGGATIAGTACDDGDAGTENDVYGEDCSCNGTPIDGVVLGCTNELYCNYNPSATVDDGSCIGNDCLGNCGGTALPGTRCDDFSALTINDIYNSNCECVGETIENICELESFDFNYACEDDNSVTVTLSFEGEGKYDGTDGLSSYTNMESGTFVYENFPTHSGFEFILSQTEGNNVGCIVIKKFNTPRCLPYNSDAGLIGINDYTQQEINVCEGDLLQLRNTGSVLGPYQSLFFIIHSAGPNIGLADLPINEEDVFVYDRDIDNTAELSGIYWATAVVATSSPQGMADYDDPNLAISNTVQINLLEQIELNHSSTCDEETGEYTFNLEIDGGLPGLDGNTSYNVESNYFNGSLNAGETYTSEPIPNGAMYYFEVTDENGCDVKSETFIVDCMNPLPIELISFDGEALPTGNLLKWVTASEINNDFFTIKSSTNGIDYKEVSSVAGNGTNSGSSNYSYLHRSVSSGTTYYKLIQTDFDGTTVEVANIELVRAESTEFNIISILPVPAINNLEITLQNAEEQTVFEIFDVIGRPVLKEIYNAEQGIDVFKLNVKNLSAGVYFISILNNDKAITKRFIKD